MKLVVIFAILGVFAPISWGLQCNTCADCWEDATEQGGWLGDALSKVGISVNAQAAAIGSDFTSLSMIESYFGTDCTNMANPMNTTVEGASCMALSFTLKYDSDSGGAFNAPAAKCSILAPSDYLFMTESDLLSDGMTQSEVDDLLEMIGNLGDSGLESDLEMVMDDVSNITLVYAMADFCEDNDFCNTWDDDEYTIELTVDLGIPWDSDFDDSGSATYAMLDDLLDYFEEQFADWLDTEDTSYTLSEVSGSTQFMFEATLEGNGGWSNNEVIDLFNYLVDEATMEDENNQTLAEREGWDTTYFDSLDASEPTVTGSAEGDGQRKDGVVTNAASLGLVLCVAVSTLIFSN